MLCMFVASIDLLQAQEVTDAGKRMFPRLEVGDFFTPSEQPSLGLPSLPVEATDAGLSSQPSLPVERFLPKYGMHIPYWQNPSPMLKGDFTTDGMLWHHRSGMLWGTGNQETLPGIGRINEVSWSYLYQLGDKWDIQMGIEAVKLNRMHLSGQYVGFDGMLQYHATDRLTFRAFGAYYPGQTYGMQSSGYGGSMKVQVTDRFDMELGVRRVYNAFSNQWETVPIAIPGYRFTPKFKLEFDVGGLLFDILRHAVMEPNVGRTPGSATIAPPSFSFPR